MASLVIFLGVAAFLFGLVVGSFLNVCIYRLPREESLVYPPSHCPKCYQPIRPEDNIPVLSWLLLRGRCRSCGLRISLVYPAVELFTALLFLVYYLRFAQLYLVALSEPPSTGGLIYYAAFFFVNAGFISALFVATVIDFRYLIIPDEISLPGIVAGLAASFIWPQMHGFLPAAPHAHWQSLLASVIGAVTGAGVIYGIGAAGKAVLGREAMGFGDVKLMGMIGAFLGWKLTLFVVFLSAALGTVYGAAHIAVTGNSRIPYGPFLSAAAVISLIFRPEIDVFLSNMLRTYRMLFR